MSTDPTPTSTPLPRPWRVWIAENLMRGAAPEHLRPHLHAAGLPLEAVEAELAAAAGHPWVEAGARGHRVATKREWAMTALEELAALEGPPAVPRVRGIDRGTFEREFYARNRPVVLQGELDDWGAPKRWSFLYLKEKFGHVPLEVQQGREGDRHFDIHHDRLTTHTTLGAFIDRCEALGTSNDLYVTARNAVANGPHLAPLFEGDIGQIGGDLLDKTSPYWRPFFWLGPAGTRTPLHHDLNNILFSQILGRKRVRMLSPLASPLVYNFFGMYSEVDPDAFDPEKHPLFQRARLFDVTLEPGDVLFIPVGWWHHVVALDPSISLGFVHLTLPNLQHVGWKERVGYEPDPG